MYYGVTYDLDLTNETAVRFGLSQGKEICIYYEEVADPIRQPEEITVAVVKGDLGLCWYADLTFMNSNDDLRNSRLEEFGTKEEALDCAIGWVRIYR